MPHTQPEPSVCSEEASQPPALDKESSARTFLYESLGTIDSDAVKNFIDGRSQLLKALAHYERLGELPLTIISSLRVRAVSRLYDTDERALARRFMQEAKNSVNVSLVRNRIEGRRVLLDAIAHYDALVKGQIR